MHFRKACGFSNRGPVLSLARFAPGAPGQNVPQELTHSADVFVNRKIVCVLQWRRWIQGEAGQPSKTIKRGLMAARSAAKIGLHCFPFCGKIWLERISWERLQTLNDALRVEFCTGAAGMGVRISEQRLDLGLA
jgi:hypothetical protein